MINRWVLLAILVCMGVVFLFWRSGQAEAHPLPSGTSVKVKLHKVMCPALGRFCDRAPRPGPQEDCDASRAPYIVIIYDPILDADVEWQCREDGRWYRLRIVPGGTWNVITAAKALVLDWMRACPQLACKRVLRKHYYSVYRGPHFAEGSLK